MDLRANHRRLAHLSYRSKITQNEVIALVDSFGDLQNLASILPES